ncbi:MAG: DUF3971 domain-containing protein [Alphaproteobacteria bacterium]|nr:DUF3971 domain-containing protein [Alphaproteobacteria bacterium]
MTTGAPFGGERTARSQSQRPPPLTQRVPAPRRRRRRKAGPWRRRANLCFVGLLPVLLLVGIAGVVIYTRLLQGPISLDRYAGSIEKSISTSLGALNAKVDDVALVLTEDNGFEFRLINLTLTDSSGGRVAAAPVASVSLRPLDLIIGRIVPSRVYLIDPELLVTYRKASGFSLQVATQLIEPPALVSEGQNAPDRLVDSSIARQAPSAGQTEAARRIDIARLVSDMNARARQGIDAHAALKEIGVRNATVVLDYEGQRTEWLIAEAAVDLENQKRGNTISGAARVQSDRGPWVFSFSTVETERDNVVRLTASARDLVPSSIARAAPALSLLETLDMPVALDATMQVTDAGDMEAATLAVEFAAGQVHLPSVSGTPLQLDGCVFNVSYDGYAKRFTIAPSTLQWADSFLTVSGEATPVQQQVTGEELWRYRFDAVDGMLAAKEFGVGGVKIDSWISQGTLSLTHGKLDIEQFDLSAGGVGFSANGTLLAGDDHPSTQVSAKLTSSDLKKLTALWPRALAPAARDWVGRHVVKGQVTSGTMRLVSGGYMSQEAPAGGAQGERISVALEVDDFEAKVDPTLAVARADRALIRLENDVLEVTVPEIAVSAGDGGSAGYSVGLKTLRLSAVNLYGDKPLAEVAFKVKSPIKSVLNLLQKLRPEALPVSALPTDAVRGLVEGTFKLALPLDGSEAGKPKLIEGKAKVKDFRLSKKIDGYAIRGGVFDVDISDTAVDATGDILVNGVGAKIKWQHILGGALDQQPPLTISTRLDASDRDQLSLDINDIVAGEIPVVINVGLRDRGTPAIHVVADLTSADLLFSEVAWRKPSGRATKLEFDVVSAADDRIELQNIQVVGQGIAIEGWAAVGKNKALQEYYFPDFSVDTVTRLRLQGKLNSRRVWKVKVVGPTYDGRTFFKSLFSLGDLSKERPSARKPAKGVDLEARIENVVGSGNTTLRQFEINISHRAGKLTSLNGKGKLENGNDVAVLLKRASGKRTLFAESNDAGTVFKLIDFYPNMVGGRGRLELDLDGRGDASQTGTLWVENFRILGDAVASEVFASAGGAQGKKKAQRQVFDFSRLRLPFSVGHGQFVIRDSYLRGPVLGASVRGKVDYRQRRVNLGGTYIPLQGLNSALCGIPLLGDIFTGPKCEGMLGITYAVQGSMERPQVIVNPLSLVAPGIFRDIFQLTNPSTKVVPRKQGRPDLPPEKRVRASSSASTGGGNQGSGRSSDSPVIDGWSSGTRTPR